MKHLCLLLSFALVSCDDSSSRPRLTAQLPPPPHEELGPELTEKGKVLEVGFVLGSTTTTTTPGHTSVIKKSDWEDPFGMHNKTMVVPSTSTTVKVPDRFAVAFECQHGKFLIQDDGADSRAGQLWKKLKKGDEVNIRYKEVFYVVPAEESRKKLDRYEFVDADPIRN